MPHRIPVPIVNKELSQQGGRGEGKGMEWTGQRRHKVYSRAR